MAPIVTLLSRVRSRVRRARDRQPDAPTPLQENASYDVRLARELIEYAEVENVHDLPRIHHYWAGRYLLPQLSELGITGIDEFFVDHLERAASDAGDHPARFVSIGAGNCDTEVRLATMLVARGTTDFVIECLDINPAMLERGRVLARDAGLERQVMPIQADFNDWHPDGSYDGVMANQALHHVLKLEDLLDAVERSLAPHGVFVVSDMIGRNGHMRWPEALEIVHEFWQELPESYRWNLLLNRHEELLENWDCSTEGFEGIRSQDILPLLIERFDFELFSGFGNLIDPFIDRCFGHHFDPDAEWDTTFIDRVHARDEAELLAGNITPTHILAVMRRAPYEGPFRCHAHLTPRFCVRAP